MPAREVALEHYRQRKDLLDAVGTVAGQMWSEVDRDHIADSWARQIPELTAVTAGAQLAAARQADRYVAEALDEQDLDDEAAAPIDPAGFAGTASDGRGLASLLANPVVVALLAIQDGVDVTRALLGGRANLDMLVRTQVADAGRLADQVALTARPAATGYVRVAVGNSCSRCLILAGRVYAWNTGFQRHPRCDCVHLPTAIAKAGRLTQSPRAIYDRMTQAERARAGFTAGDQLALAEGADIYQVVNAHRGGLAVAGGRQLTTEGTTRRGLAGARLGRRGRQTGRLTPDQIFRDAADRDEALRLLHRNGYLLEEPATLARAEVPVAAAAPAPRTAPPSAAAATPGPDIRPELEAARTPFAVSQAFRREYRRITGGYASDVDFQGSAATAREHAEGLLRGLERFPETRLRGVSTFEEAGNNAYAHAIGPDIQFNYRWTQPSARREYLSSVANDVDSGWHPRGTGSPMGIAIHEFGHTLDLHTLGQAIRSDLDELLRRRAAEEILDADDFVRYGSSVDALIAREISGYARTNRHELVAEAFGDVMLNGERAGRLSREIFDLLEAEYRRGGRRVAAAPARAAASRPAPGPDLARMTVPQLRALAQERGIRVPSRARKAEIVELLRGATPTPPAAAAAEVALERMTVAQLRALARERGVKVPSRARKAEIVDLLSSKPTPTPPPPPLPSRDAKLISEIMADPYTDDRTFKQAQEFIERQKAEVARAIDGTYAGLTVKIRDVRASARDIRLHGLVYDADGRQVGNFSRYIYRDIDTGEIHVEHVLLQLSKTIQGSGFAAAFNANLYDWYRRSGLTRVNVHANIDVGGYTWATQGFDFSTAAAARAFVDSARQKVDKALAKTPKGLTRAQVIELDKYVTEMRGGRIPASAPDIARFGRQPGQGGRNSLWPGKWLMLKSDWYGSLYL